jgi:dolichyl-diphosphooligosaccharide---protein glycosyltransferase
MVSFSRQVKKLSSLKWWDSSLIVGLAIAVMIFTRFYGLGEPYIKAFDPYYFWRVSEGIWEHGYWQADDPLRYYPYGWDSSELTPAVPYTFVYLAHVAGDLKAAVKFYPAMFGLLSVVAMAMLGRKLGMSGLASLALAVIPAYMFRTSQGFADKEALAFFIGILGWYFAAVAVEEKKHMPAIYSGITIGMLAGVWGGKVLFALSLVPLVLLMMLKERTKEVSVISTVFVSYLFMHVLIPRYRTFYRDPVSLAILGIAVFGYLLHYIYQMKGLKKYGNKRMLIALGIGGALSLAVSVFAFGNPVAILQHMITLYQDPNYSSGTITHFQTVAENQRPTWTWDLSSNQFFAQFGMFFFIAIALLILPIARKVWSLVTKKGAYAQDYVYAAGLAIATAMIVINFPYQTPVLLFLLGIPGMMEKGDWKESLAISIVAFSMFSSFSVVRLFIFGSVGAVIGSAYFMKVLLENRETVTMLIGYAVVIYAFYQIYPSTLGYRESLAGTSLTTTWFENTKWMEFNVPQGEPMTTWWDYGYWIQTLGDTVTLGDGGNVGPAYTINTYTGHFFATDDYANATAWADDWNLTYFTVDAQMLPKFWAYSTLGGISNVLNQIRFQQTMPTEFGVIGIYTGISDDYGPVAVGELSVDNQPVYILGKIVGGAVQWMGIIDEYAYFSNEGVIACEPMGYCPSADFGNYARLNQSAIVYPNSLVVLGDKASMHSTFARLWFFDGYNTDFELLLNNGETKTFRYGG